MSESRKESRRKMRLIYNKSTAWMWSVAIDAYLELSRFDRDGWADNIAAARSMQKRLIDDKESMYLTSSEAEILKTCVEIVEAAKVAWRFQIEDMMTALED